MGNGRLFPYSGSKARLVPYLPAPPTGTQTIVEPFVGSAAYSMAHRPTNVYIADVNPKVGNLWQWLKDTATVDGLHTLQSTLDRAREQGDKVDVRTLGLTEHEVTLARLMVASVVKGQLSSWQLYPQHRANTQALIDALPYIRRAVRVVGTSYLSAFFHAPVGSLIFVDPPYAGTQANYKDGDSSWTPREAAQLSGVIQQAADSGRRVLLTYGDGAQDVFPQFEWVALLRRKVPNLRRGGTVDRTEWMSKIGW